MENKDKINAFEYIVYCLSEWFKNETNNDPSDFSKLKLFKLHFFVCAVKSANQNDLLSLFDNFHALPYGPVESDVYDNLNNLVFYKIDRFGMTSKKSDITDSSFKIESEIKEKIKKAIGELKAKNPKIVTYDAIRLVDISHKWTAWDITYKSALKKGCHSKLIPLEYIRSSHQIFI